MVGGRTVGAAGTVRKESLCAGAERDVGICWRDAGHSPLCGGIMRLFRLVGILFEVYDGATFDARFIDGYCGRVLTRVEVKGAGDVKVVFGFAD